MDNTRQNLQRLKWLAVIVPAISVFLYETVRHDFLEHLLPTDYGNVIVGFLTLLLAYVFAEVIFGAVDKLYRRVVTRERELAALNATAHEQERLGRDLHDGLAQVVSYLMLRLDTVDSLVRSNRSDAALHELSRLRQITDDLYIDVRESISGLRSRVSEVGLLPAIRTYGEEFEERHGIPIELTVSEGLPEVEAKVSVQLFRVVQEALTNVRKHSGATRVYIEVAPASDGGIDLRVRDDGRGFNVLNQQSQSFGIPGMKERTSLVGGTLAIESKEGEGTTVLLHLPTPSLEREATREHLPASSG